jgi:hypothetical protein
MPKFLHTVDGRQARVEVVSLLGPIAGAALPVGIDNEHIAVGRCSHTGKIRSERGFTGATFFS